jgi:hypothetical protein
MANRQPSPYCSAAAPETAADAGATTIVKTDITSEPRSQRVRKLSAGGEVVAATGANLSNGIGGDERALPQLARTNELMTEFSDAELGQITREAAELARELAARR